MLEKIKGFADGMDTLRIWPRAFLGVYLWLLVDSTEWFLELQAPTMEQAGFMSVVVGAGVAWFGAYVNSGKK